MNKTILFLLTLSIIIMSSCTTQNSDYKQENTTTALTLNIGKQNQIIITPSAEGCIFTSENKLIASVTESGQVTGVTVGEVTINISNPQTKFTSKCKVTIAPLYTMYREPLVKLGSSISDIKSYELRTLQSETSAAINYAGENSNVERVLYSLENSKLLGALCLIPISKSSLIVNFLNERYIYQGYSSSDNILAMYSSNDNKYYVLLYYYNINYLTAVYVPNSNATQTQATSDEILKTIKLGKEKILKNINK